MTPLLHPAKTPTMYFIGVTTSRSSIMKVFPAWAEHLGLKATIKGIDLPLDDDPQHYRDVVEFIKRDQLSLGALVTTHKLNLYKASRDLFNHVGEDTTVIDEISSISKRGPDLWGHALDPITSGLSLEAIVPGNHWARTGGQLLLLGAGGSSLALTLYLHRQALAGHDVPARIAVTNHRPDRLREMKEVHQRMGMAIPVDYHLTPTPQANDEQVAALSPHSVVANGTGLGKDRPGSPLTDAAIFPQHGIAWDFNYRGDLLFLKQAHSQLDDRELTVADGWIYFIHGWTRVIAQVFDINIATSGKQFDRLSNIAYEVSTAMKT